MKITKEYHWEMGHRLPFHPGPCKNLHGHSYKAYITLEGTPDANGILIDFYDIDRVMQPLLNRLDHAFILADSDTEVIQFFKKLNSKHEVVPFHSTAENLALYFIEEIRKSGLPSNIKGVGVSIYETADASATASVEF
ncbi:MAG: 6-carboxytetrahydropterin synthase [Ignavibacteriaceae bacterium]|nr:6-carboxytetrahydropterin synthase [Ignavibacteriaceae bacterium]